MVGGLISPNNRKTCCDCGRKIKKGEYCWRVQDNDSKTDGTRHICEACSVHLARSLTMDIRTSRISGGSVLNTSSCMVCHTSIPRGDKAGQIRVRPLSTVKTVRKGVHTTTRTRKVCPECLGLIAVELRTLRDGMEVTDAPKYLTSNSNLLKEIALEVLNE